MATKTKKPTFVTMACSVCKNRNYLLPKSHMLKARGKGATATTKLALSKFCPHCRKHTPHVETK